MTIEQFRLENAVNNMSPSPFKNFADYMCPSRGVVKRNEKKRLEDEQEAELIESVKELQARKSEMPSPVELLQANRVTLAFIPEETIPILVSPIHLANEPASTTCRELDTAESNCRDMVRFSATHESFTQAPVIVFMTSSSARDSGTVFSIYETHRRMAAQAATGNLTGLFEIVGDIPYYQLTLAVIKRAETVHCRAFHPDKHPQADSEEISCLN
jgi:hypothetical protein